MDSKHRREQTFTVLHLFCGLGGGALGFQQAMGAYKGSIGKFRTLLGVDNDAAACRDFAALTGAPALQADIATMSAEELRAAVGDAPPDVVFMSPPCKGFSGLLPSARAAGEKYQALNRLVLQGIWLILKTWNKVPKLILIENVPRITSRGAALLLQVKQLLAEHGYKFAEGFHDCGELGGLAQHRRRYLLLARHEQRLPTFVYHPRMRRVRAIGEVLGALPMPDDPAAGRLHRLPRLAWRTWVRLALIPAGGDWRDLPAGEYEVSGDPSKYKGRPGLMRVADWDQPSSAVTGAAKTTGGNATAAVADPRPFKSCIQCDTMGGEEESYGAMEASAGLADVRGERSGAGAEFAAGGADAVGDAEVCGADVAAQDGAVSAHRALRRTAGEADSVAQPGAARVRRSRASRHGGAAYQRPESRLPVDEPLLVHAQGEHLGQGAARDVDARGEALPGQVESSAGADDQTVEAWDGGVGAGTGSLGGRGGSGSEVPHLEACRLSIGRKGFSNVFRVVRWDETPGAVTAGSGPSSSGICVADPRLGHKPRGGAFRVVPWDDSAPTVTTAGGVGRSSAFGVADPRLSLGQHHNKLRVEDWDKPAHTVTGSDRVGSGAPSVADPRLGCAPRAGAYGVLAWDEPAGAVIGVADVHAGKAAVADPRTTRGEVPVIISEDGCWHRPLTTLELAALQGLPLQMRDGRPLELDGKADARWRERIGNAVPPPTARAIGECLLDSLMPAAEGDGWAMGSGGIWVRPALLERLRAVA